MKHMKKPISATVDEELIEWISRKVAEGSTFRNRSHVVERALELLRQMDKKR